MTIKRTTVGTGITTRDRVSYSGEDIFVGVEQMIEVAKVADSLEGGYFALSLAEVIGWCDHILAGDGPDHRDSEKDFARRIRHRYDFTLAMIKRGDVAMTARSALDLGVLSTEAQIKFTWEPHVDRGLCTLNAAREGHKKVHGSYEQKQTRWQTIVADFENEVASGTKRTAAYEIVGQRHGVSGKTVQRATKRKS